MADIRIKDLTTLESASLTGDVFVIDGTTGTRKLSAFSPSFGGNATVTGTLTVNGTSATVGSGTGSIVSKLNGAAGSYKLSIYQSAGVDRWYAGLAAGAEGGSDGGAPYSIVALTDAGAVIDNALLITRAAGGSITTPRPVAISSTTASTTTSSGALVVGNGTSGGLGVGGAINAGGDIATAATMRSVGFHVPGNGASRPASTDSYLASTATTKIPLYVSGYTGGGQTADILRVSLNSSSDWFAVKGNGQVACYVTTASTSTSSGALVVSGGVGVAGSINTDGTLRFNANSSLPGAGSLGISSTYGLNFYASTGSSYDFSVFSAAGQSVLLVPTGTRNVSFSGTLTTVGNITSGAAITTSAPVGGAGLWELGTYSSTAPSATGYVTIEIGGTLYKLLASNV